MTIDTDAKLIAARDAVAAVRKGLDRRLADAPADAEGQFDFYLREARKYAGSAEDAMTLAIYHRHAVGAQLPTPPAQIAYCAIIGCPSPSHPDCSHRTCERHCDERCGEKCVRMAGKEMPSYHPCKECGKRQCSSLCRNALCCWCCADKCKCPGGAEPADEHERRHGIGDVMDADADATHFSTDGKTMLCGRDWRDHIETWTADPAKTDCPKCRAALAKVASQEQ